MPTIKDIPGPSPRDLNRIRFIILEYKQKILEIWYGHCG